LPHQVFISYATTDRPVVGPLRLALESCGIACWLAPDDIPPQTDYPAAIIEAINACELLLLILSRAADASPHVPREVERAVAKQRPVLVLLIEKFALSPSLEYLLSMSQWFDATTSPLETYTDRICTLTARLLAVESPGLVATTGPSRVEILVERRDPFDLTVDALAISRGAFERRTIGQGLKWSERRIRLAESEAVVATREPGPAPAPVVFLYPERLLREPSEDAFRNTVCAMLIAAQRQGAVSFAVAPTGKTRGFSRTKALRATLDGYADYLATMPGGRPPTVDRLHFALKETTDARYELNLLSNEMDRCLDRGPFAEAYRLVEKQRNPTLLSIRATLGR
jgi:hypothetical protein